MTAASLAADLTPGERAVAVAIERERAIEILEGDVPVALGVVGGGVEGEVAVAGLWASAGGEEQVRRRADRRVRTSLTLPSPAAGERANNP
jgi:hypothetical protein